MKGRIKYSGNIIEIKPITSPSLTTEYKWEDSVSGVYYKEDEIEILPETKNEFYGQICQDPQINEDFNKLHHYIVNSIINFCNKYNLDVDEACISVDGIKGSIPYGQWMCFTDSSFSMYGNDEKPYLWSI